MWVALTPALRVHNLFAVSLQCPGWSLSTYLGAGAVLFYPAAQALVTIADGYCGGWTTSPNSAQLALDGVVVGLTGGQQVSALRAESVGTIAFNVTCAAGFSNDESISAVPWALGTCNVASGAPVIALPNASTFACLPTASITASLMSPVDPAWWLTSDAMWWPTAQGTSAAMLSPKQAYSGGMAFFTPLQVSVDPALTLKFDVSFALSGNPADGIALVLHNDPRGVYAPTCPTNHASCSGYNCNRACANTVTNAVYLYAPKTWNNGLTANYLSTGAFLSGSTPSSLTAGLTLTTMPNLANGDVISTLVTYELATGLLSWTMTRTTGLTATESFSQYVGDLRGVLGGSQAWLGFSAATGGWFAGHSVSNVQVFPRCNAREL